MNFIKQFSIFTTLLFTLCMGLIISVDPYEKYGINVFGFKTKAVMFGREVKFRMLDNTSNKYEAFILGSSAAHRYRTKDVEEITGLKTFNYALQHTTPEDYLAVTRHIFSKQRPQIIFLQMDFYALNKNFKVDPRLYSSPLKKFLKKNSNNYFDSKAISNTYLTIDALRDSIRVIGVNLFSKPRHIYLEHGDYPKEKEKNQDKVPLSQAGYGEYSVDPERIQILKKLKELVESNGAKLIVFTTPHSYEHVQSIYSQGLSGELQEFKGILKNVFGELYDFTNDDSKEFSKPKYMRDSSHPTPLLSKLVIQKIMENEGERQFGRRLSSD